MDVITPTPQPPTVRKVFYNWHRTSLEQRLQALKPEWAGQDLDIVSRDLESNASFVNYVRHHRVSVQGIGKPVEVVEKSIRKLAFLSSQEARFHRADGMILGSTHFRHPNCLGVFETPWESMIFTAFIKGKPPRMQAIAKQLALGIAELEGQSHDHLNAQPLHQAPLYWSMDFFRPWFLLRPRFNFARCLPDLHRLGQEDDRFAGLTERFKMFVPIINRLAAQARRSPRCISHMDYLRKNLFLVKGKLHLIDWSEVKVGRVGFDGGAYLGSLFRRKDMNVYLSAQNEFTEAYAAALPERFQTQQALDNQRYVFLLTALFHCLRPDTIQEYRDLDRMALLREKYDYLLELRHRS